MNFKLNIQLSQENLALVTFIASAIIIIIAAILSGIPYVFIGYPLASILILIGYSVISLFIIIIRIKRLNTVIPVAITIIGFILGIYNIIELLYSNLSPTMFLSQFIPIIITAITPMMILIKQHFTKK